MSENERFGLVFAKTGSINSDTVQEYFKLAHQTEEESVGIPPVPCCL
jgi:hypothetical protein